MLINPVYSSKKNNNKKYKRINTVSIKQKNNELIKIPIKEKKALSYKEIKIPDNPLPFVKIKPKKLLY